MSQTTPDGHLALPASGGGQPVLVLHAWWGLNGTIRSVCDRLADAGFAAFAPDLYQGRVTDTVDGAEALAEALFENLDRARADVMSSARYLLAHSASADGGVSVIGFSLGAFLALDLSVRAPEMVRSVAVFYGTGPDDFSAARASYLGHFAETDPFEPAEQVDALEAALRRANRPATLYRYPGTGHWFFEPDRADAYDVAAAGLAWERTLAFLGGTPAP